MIMSLLCRIALCVLPLCIDGSVDHINKQGIHNPVFDQEALLASQGGVDELVELPKDVRHTRLTNLATSHDQNNDGIIEADELYAWMIDSFAFIDRTTAAEKIREHDENGDGNITIAELFHAQFGLSDEDLKTLKAGDDDESKETLELLEEERKRFEAADLDKDNTLDEGESTAFFLPYNYPHMFPMEMAKVMKDFDQNGDGFVSKEEFSSGDEVDDETRREEMANFHDLDVDQDGQLSQEEVWSMSDNERMAKDEVHHLMEVCDMDRDGKLSIHEIVTQEEEFMSSSATDFGRIMQFVKDEL